MRRNKKVAIGICLLICISSYASQTDNHFFKIDQLISSGEYQSALNQISNAEANLPLTERLTAWEIDSRGEVIRVVHGRDYLYYQLHVSNSQKDAPGLQNALETVSVNFIQSDWKFTVVCVELKTGKIRWSRAINGLVNLAADPRTDILYLYNERLISLDPNSGKVFKRYDPPEGKHVISGLIFGGILAEPDPHGSPITLPNSIIPLYNPDSGLISEVNFADYWLVSPNEKCKLMPANENRKWDCTGLPYNNKLWSLDVPLEVTGTPLWNGDNPTFIMNTKSQLGVVKCFDQLSGNTKWSTVLGWGDYDTKQHQLNGGGYSDNWRPLSALTNYLLALDESGRLYFVDPAEGHIAASPQLDRNYLAMPFQYGEQLITVSFNWIRSYSIANLIHPENSLHTALQVRKAKCLTKIGQQKEAMALLDKLVELAPQSIIAWSQRADLCKATGNLEEEIFSRCKVMSLTDKVEDETLLNHFGLLRLYNLKGKPAWKLAEADGHIYTGTLAGDIWAVRTDNLNIEHVTSLEDGITSLQVNPEMEVVLGNSIQTNLSFSKKPFLPEKNVPVEWYTEGGTDRISAAVSYRGRQFRSMTGGRVRILSGTVMEDLPALLDDIKDDWSIYISPAGAMGYGEGVFELDENLRPSRWLIRPKVTGKNPEQIKVQYIQSTHETIGLVVASSNGSALQAYSHNGELLNETSLDSFISGTDINNGFIPMNNGYLFSDRQLVWISADSSHKVWRFGPSFSRTTSGRYADRWRFFGSPLLVNGCLYVTGLDGQLYIFDSAHIIETASTTDEAVTKDDKKQN